MPSEQQNDGVETIPSLVREGPLGKAIEGKIALNYRTHTVAIVTKEGHPNIVVGKDCDFIFQRRGWMFTTFVAQCRNGDKFWMSVRKHDGDKLFSIVNSASGDTG